MSAHMSATLQHHQRLRPAQGTGGYAVRPLMKVKREEPQLSEETRSTFEAISDPANAHLFTVAAALKALAHVKI